MFPKIIEKLYSSFDFDGLNSDQENLEKQFPFIRLASQPLIICYKCAGIFFFYDC